MREIKFRAWDKRRKQVRDVLSVQYFQKPLPVLGAVRMVPEDDTLDNESLNRHSDIELMQYTGLKDKNGVEIYEGDIVLDDDRPLKDWQGLPIKENIENPDKYVVEYDNRTCVFEPFGTHDMSVTTAEVIGNIYENPELLEAHNAK